VLAFCYIGGEDNLTDEETEAPAGVLKPDIE
jgi:hypothetical protein